MSSDINVSPSPLAGEGWGEGAQATTSQVDNIAIRVENLSKCYTLYDAPRDRLKQFILPRLQRVVGKPARNYYREFWALKEVSFVVRKGETLGIIGRNGSGKSTLLQIICGTLTPSSGTVDTKGRIAALLELGSGFNPEFTGRENVYMNGSVLGLSKEEIDARFDEIAAFADIGEFLYQPVRTYSSGMYVRLAFAVIAHVNADVLIIDEALAVGDAFFVQKCMRFLRDFMTHGTVLFVSHDTGAVVNLCKRAVWLHKGQVELDDTPKHVTEAYLSALYEANQGVGSVTRIGATEEVENEQAEPKDMRLEIINASPYRNDIELFRFDPDAPSFGKGGASITSVYLTDKAGTRLSWIVGGEEVQLIIRGKATAHLYSPIIGFLVKDRLGQTLFGDNTFLTHRNAPVPVLEGQTLEARFDFCMPLLPVGDYSICVAIADGTQDTHVQHHWIHDALLFRSQSSSVCHGLVGIPMSSITISVE